LRARIAIFVAVGTFALAIAGQALAVAPTVTGLTPNHGPAEGGTSVTITGTNLNGATAVQFGATDATSFNVENANQINAIAPPGTAGSTVDVTVTADGPSANTDADDYTYDQPPPPEPTVTSLNPNQGPTAGGTSVTITGTNLNGATAVQFGATDATSFNVENANQINAIAPPGTGTVDVTVTTPRGTSANTAADNYTYFAPPTVTGVSPNQGPTAGGTSVTITGTNLSGATAVQFGGTDATAFNVDNATHITATAPAGTGTVNVTVTTPGGTSANTAADNYTYFAPPTVTGVSPNQGPTAGGTPVTITGTNLTGATAVQFGSTNTTSFTVDNATRISATAPARAAGPADVRVTTPGGTSANTAADNYTYVPAPTVTSLVPNHGAAAGGTLVTIHGTNLSGANAVRFDDFDATAFTVDNASQITATAPPGVGGTPAEVTVTTPGGTSSTTGSGNNYFYDVPPDPAPEVSGLVPNHGSAAGGTTVIITGSHFDDATAVRFGAIYAPSFTFDSASQITVTAPPGAAGATVDVQVITGAGASPDSSADDYTYDPPPPAAAGPTPASVPIEPNTFLNRHPPHRTHKRKVTFRFSSNMAGAKFRCLYAQGWQPCRSPHTFRHLKPGRYRFQAQAVVNGVPDPSPASWTFRVLLASD
jgi:hypothetical protein